MDKKLILTLLFTLIITSFALSDSISDYKVPFQVNLGDFVTATGIYNDTNNVSGLLCDFYFFDEQGFLVKRATAQYTTTTGRITMAGFPMTEPLFKRDSNYTLRTECGTAFADANFTVIQRESIAHVGSQEFEYVTNPENTDTIFIWILMILFVVFLVGIGVLIWKGWKK